MFSNKKKWLKENKISLSFLLKVNETEVFTAEDRKPVYTEEFLFSNFIQEKVRYIFKSRLKECEVFLFWSFDGGQ